MVCSHRTGGGRCSRWSKGGCLHREGSVVVGGLRLCRVGIRWRDRRRRVRGSDMFKMAQLDRSSTKRTHTTTQHTNTNTQTRTHKRTKHTQTQHARARSPWTYLPLHLVVVDAGSVRVVDVGVRVFGSLHPKRGVGRPLRPRQRNNPRRRPPDCGSPGSNR